MTKRPAKAPPRLFTVESANRTLPLVRAIVADLAPLWQEARELRSRIEYFAEHRESEEGDPYSDELTAMREKLARDTQLVEGYVDELRQLGVEHKGSGGHVAFPAMLEGRIAYLSWRLGESEISHWMELDADQSQRQSLLAGSVPRDDGSPSL